MNKKQETKQIKDIKAARKEKDKIIREQNKTIYKLVSIAEKLIKDSNKDNKVIELVREKESAKELVEECKEPEETEEYKKLKEEKEHIEETIREYLIEAGNYHEVMGRINKQVLNVIENRVVNIEDLVYVTEQWTTLNIELEDVGERYKERLEELIDLVEER